jgi:hypothetical protein
MATYRGELELLLHSARSLPEFADLDLNDASLLKRWLLGMHQGAVSREHLD